MAKVDTKIEDLNATDWRAYFDSTCLRVWHLNGKDRTYKVTSVTRQTGEMISGKAREVKKQPRLELEDDKGRAVPLPLLLNKTNSKTIAQMYGNNPHHWVGKWITLFVATGIDTPQGPSDAIRIRNQVPKTKTKAGAGSVAQSSSVQSAPAEDDGPRDYRDVTEDTDEPPPDVDL